MSDETKTVTVTCEFSVEVPAELDLNKIKDYNKAIDVVAQEIHQRGLGEIRESIDDINYE